MREFWIVLLVLAVLPLAGCEAIGAVYSVTLFMAGLLVVAGLWLAAFLAMRVRQRRLRSDR